MYVCMYGLPNVTSTVLNRLNRTDMLQKQTEQHN